MSLTMIKLEPDMGRLIRWAQKRGLREQRGEDDLGYALHALLVATFGREPLPLKTHDN
jgi:CRISPR system Cascade subunit CasE